MRFLFGIIVGVCLTIGTAFIVDSWDVGPSVATTGSASTVVDHRQMVNWDVVGENWRTAKQRARETWTALSQKVSS